MDQETKKAKLSRGWFLGAVGAGSLLAASLIGCRQPEATETLSGNNEQFADTLRFLTNQERERHGLSHLEEDETLTSGAESYASFLAQVNFPYSSLGTSAPSLVERLRDSGFEPPSGTQVGEAFIPGFRVSPQTLLAGLLNNQQTSEVLLQNQFKYIGVGCFSIELRIWCVQYFAGDSAH